MTHANTMRTIANSYAKKRVEAITSTASYENVMLSINTKMIMNAEEGGTSCTFCLDTFGDELYRETFLWTTKKERAELVGKALMQYGYTVKVNSDYSTIEISW